MLPLNFECYVERVMTFLYGPGLLLGMWFQQEWHRMWHCHTQS